MRMGLPKVLTSDQGREFRNKLDKELMKLLGIKRYHTTPIIHKYAFLQVLCYVLHYSLG